MPSFVSYNQTDILDRNHLDLSLNRYINLHLFRKHYILFQSHILLQNHQLLIQLEYQAQQIEELTEKVNYFENKYKEIQRDLEIHKEVEGINFSIEELEKVLYEVNKNNLSDLDALYFFDKIEMNNIE